MRPDQIIYSLENITIAQAIEMMELLNKHYVNK